ncbi:hypothetical protein P171DRAFT_446488 [Karstenula rhodostoma CBS 690.94]|uniref:Uncharacterized protein n=1 Tax=Karstenula rhodostoma CBS 690.94 TaxID=1392251 RepID=A0A9P4PAW1_9PLEO|nr:hypothetical protein P171DRAFT_446488 [Karstenula rhodostoma CBS 690.94]
MHKEFWDAPPDKRLALTFWSNRFTKPEPSTSQDFDSSASIEALKYLSILGKISPRIRALWGLMADICVCQERKVVIFCLSPLEQMIVAIVLRVVGLKAKALLSTFMALPSVFTSTNAIEPPVSSPVSTLLYAYPNPGVMCAPSQIYEQLRTMSLIKHSAASELSKYIESIIME